MGFNVSEGVLDALSSSGVSLKINGNTAKLGDSANIGDVWTIETDSDKRLLKRSDFNNNSVKLYGNWSPAGTPVIYFTDSDDLKTASLTWDSSNISKNYHSIDISVEDYVEPPKEIYYTLTDSDITTLTDNETVLTRDGVVLVSGDSFLDGDLVIATTTPNRKFIDGYVTLSANWSPSYPDNIVFNYVDDNTCSYEFGSETLAINPNWNLSCSTEILSPEIVVPNKVYLIDDEILSQLNKKRFTMISDQKVDYGQYIVSVLNVPFKLPENVIGGESNIWMGDLNTEILGTQLTNDHIKFDLGTINVTGGNNNLLDYINTECIIKLPYSPNIKLEVSQVIDKTISIEYVLNTYTGNVVINIYSDSLNISSTNLDLGVKIPIINVQDFGNILNNGLYLGSDNGIRKAYISLVKKMEILPNGFYTSPIIDEDLLLNHSGFVKVEEIDLKLGDRLDREQTLMILKDGVIL